MFSVTRLLTPLLMLAACGGDETVARYGGAGQVWQLSEVNGAPAPPGITLHFPQTGQIAGTGPCNSYSARMIAPYPWFDVTNIAATRRACPQAAAEQRYFDQLTRATQSEVLGTTLILTGDGLDMVFISGG